MTISFCVCFELQWFSKKDGLRHEFEPSVVGSGTGSYRLSVVTGQHKNAGTDANISVYIHGSDASSGPHPLRSSLTNKDKFEKGKTDIFEITVAESIGEIQSVELISDNRGGLHALHPEWQYAGVALSCPNDKQIMFDQEGWLSKKDGLSAELLPSKTETKTGAGADEMQMFYTIRVWTGSDYKAGTDSQISMVMYGALGDSGLLKLESSLNNFNKFERSQLDTFEFVVQDCGKLRKIWVSSDDQKGMKRLVDGAEWQLDRITIESSDGGRYDFECDQWFGTGAGLAFEFEPSANKKPSSKEVNGDQYSDVREKDVFASGGDSASFDDGAKSADEELKARARAEAEEQKWIMEARKAGTLRTVVPSRIGEIREERARLARVAQLEEQNLRAIAHKKRDAQRELVQEGRRGQMITAQTTNSGQQIEYGSKRIDALVAESTRIDSLIQDGEKQANALRESITAASGGVAAEKARLAELSKIGREAREAYNTDVALTEQLDEQKSAVIHRMREEQKRLDKLVDAAQLLDNGLRQRHSVLVRLRDEKAKLEAEADLVMAGIEETTAEERALQEALNNHTEALARLQNTERQQQAKDAHAYRNKMRDELAADAAAKAEAERMSRDTFRAQVAARIESQTYSVPSSSFFQQDSLEYLLNGFDPSRPFHNPGGLGERGGLHGRAFGDETSLAASLNDSRKKVVEAYEALLQPRRDSLGLDLMTAGPASPTQVIPGDESTYGVLPLNDGADDTEDNVFGFADTDLALEAEPEPTQQPKKKKKSVAFALPETEAPNAESLGGYSSGKVFSLLKESWDHEAKGSHSLVGQARPLCPRVS